MKKTAIVFIKSVILFIIPIVLVLVLDISANANDATNYDSGNEQYYMEGNTSNISVADKTKVYPVESTENVDINDKIVGNSVMVTNAINSNKDVQESSNRISWWWWLIMAVTAVGIEEAVIFGSMKKNSKK